MNGSESSGRKNVRHRRKISNNGVKNEDCATLFIVDRVFTLQT